jgi:uncharacterized protein YbjT (DUF2867 family)
MNVAIVGASGFLGTHLLHHLLAKTNHSVVAISRHASSIAISEQEIRRIRLVDADVLDEEQMAEALLGCEVAYYFVHMMGQPNKDFYTQEALAANRFCAAAIAAGVKRVIYMGGLGNDHEQLSEHLLSRHNNGTILRENLPLVIEFRASMIIGRGSISYDIIKKLVHQLPVMTLPRWCISLTQPIALRDALEYLTLALNVPIEHHEIVEIGGPEVLSYKELYKRYATWSGRSPFVIRLPFLPEWLGGWWLNLFTPRGHAKIGRIMVHSLSNTMIVTHDRAVILFPDVKLRSLTQAFDEAERDSNANA